MTQTYAYPKKEKILLWILFLSVWAYLWLKAILAPMAHDEAATFFYYVQNHSFLPFFTQADANNHVLNSALTTLFYLLFGSSPVVLRLASLLSFVPYFYFTVRLSSKLSNSIIRWMFVVAFTTAAGMIEFFALCRGYGMSMALLLGAVYYLMQALQTDRTQHYALCLLFALLALTANFTLLISFLMIFGWLFVKHLSRLRRGARQNAALTALYVVLVFVPLVAVLKYLFMLQNTGALYYGSLLGFWKLSVHSIAFMFTGFSGDTVPRVVLLLFALMAVICVYIVFKQKIIPLLFHSHVVFFVMLCANIAAIVFMGKVMKINYPEDRTGLYLFPLFVGSLCFLADQAMVLSGKKYLWLPLMLPLVFFPINLIYSANFSGCNIYPYDRFPQRFFDRVAATQKPGDYPATVGGNSVKLFCWTYDNYRANGSQAPVHYWNYPSTDEDFQIVGDTDIHNWPKYYKRIDTDPFTGLMLLQRKTPWQKLLLKTVAVAAPENAGDEFFTLGQFNADSLHGKTLFFGYKLSIASAAVPFDARIVIDVSDSSHNNLSYQYLCLNWIRLRYNATGAILLNGMLVHQLPPQASTIKTYLWNLRKKPYKLKGEFSVYEMK